MEHYGPICENKDYLGRQPEYAIIPFKRIAGSLIESQKCGCRYCYIACQSVGFPVPTVCETAQNMDAMVKNDQRSLESHAPPEQKKDLLLKAHEGKSGHEFSYGGTIREVFSVDDAIDEPIPVARSISGDTTWDQSYPIVDEWFKTCIKEHNLLCPKVYATGVELPCRLVDVGEADVRNVKLVETTGGQGHYACLSYCWGGETPLQTTLEPDTLTQYKQCIEWDILPKLFQDAITVARGFGVQYLWIDSLCIIQDSLQDWQEQSALVAKIYQNAVITFAASASSGPNDSLFRTANSDHIGHPIQATTKYEHIEKIRCRVPLSHKTADLPLLQRGWAFQERLLSPRYLHFGQNELIWECMQRLTCECGTLSQGDYKWLVPKSILHPAMLKYINDFLRPTQLEIIRVWRIAVSDYSRMQLSRPEDVFPAISGIAKCVGEATGWTYVAGMWKETLIVDMIWVVEKPKTAARCKTWRAPTFSWASVSCIDVGASGNRSHISYDPASFKLNSALDESHESAGVTIYATVIETRCEPRGQDITGQLKSAFIVLRGTLIEATLRRTDKEWRPWGIAPFSGREPIWITKLYPDFDFDCTSHGIQDGERVYCLKLIGVTEPAATRRRDSFVFLVLRAVREGFDWAVASSAEPFALERIGIFRDTTDSSEPSLEDTPDQSLIHREAYVKIL